MFLLVSIYLSIYQKILLTGLTKDLNFIDSLIFSPTFLTPPPSIYFVNTYLHQPFFFTVNCCHAVCPFPACQIFVLVGSAFVCLSVARFLASKNKNIIFMDAMRHYCTSFSVNLFPRLFKLFNLTKVINDSL